MPPSPADGQPSPGTSGSGSSRAPSLEAALMEAQRRQEVLERHLRALGTLAKRRVFISEDLPASLSITTEICALALDVQRSSVWLLKEGNTALHCLHLHDQRATSQGAGGDLPAAPFPAYFAELLSGRVIAADDAQTDPRTREFTEPYLKPLGIHAMLDAPIRLGDRLVGVVCQEHTGGPRHWLPEDITFAGFIAHTISMGLETHFRKGGTLQGIPNF